MDSIEQSKEAGRKEYTMEMGRVNLVAFILIIPITALVLIPFVLIWDFNTIQIGREVFKIYFLAILLSGIVFHELLHGITWAYFAPSGWKSIKFGINWKFLTPYCHCKEPLKVKHYRLGAAMPLIVMGVFPVIIGMVIGNGVVLWFGLFFIWAAGGDMIGIYMLRTLDRDSCVSDHPDKMGFIVEA